MSRDEEPGPSPSREPQGLPLVAVMVLYGIMGGLAYGLGFWLADRNVFFWHDAWATTLPIDVAAGAGAGLVVVALSRFIERFDWARRLSQGMRKLLGRLDPTSILVLALFSSLGEEMFFRGLLQPSIGLIASSIVFGLLHIGPGREFLPWTVMAIAMGFAFGGLFYYTGNLLAPILAHFTINFFNLHALSRLELEQGA